jgi:iron complex outermembrane receptor protein
MNRIKVLAGAVSLGALMTGLGAAAAFAEDAPKAQAAAEPTALKEIVVTAQKRTEKLHDVPESVAVVNQQQLAQQGMQKLQDMQTAVPSFSMTEAPIGTNIAIRGLFSGTNQGFEQSVGMYVDGVNYSLAQQTRAPFLDVDRIEVLRGPQSILFGKDSTAGAMDIISAQPTNSYTGYIQESYNFTDHGTDTEGAFSGPIADNLKFRIAGRYDESDGWIHNATLGREEPQDKDWNLRGILTWNVTNDLDVSLKAEAGQFDVLGHNLEILDNPTSTSANPAFAGKTYGQVISMLSQLTPTPVTPSQVYPTPNIAAGQRASTGDSSNNRSQSYVLTANWRTSLGVVTAISGYTQFDTDELLDISMTGANLVYGNDEERYRQFSQELRLVSPKGQKLDYIVGAFYETSQHDYADQIKAPTDSALIPLINEEEPGAGSLMGGTRAGREVSADSNTYAAFAQVGYNFTDQWRLALGGRLTHVDEDGQRDMTIQTLDGGTLSGSQAIVAPLVYGSLFKITSSNLNQIAAMPIPQAATANALISALGQAADTGKIDQSAFNPQVTLQYKPSHDVMLYASWTTATKSGGFDMRSNNKLFYATMADEFTFRPETAETFETGFKARLLNGRAELNADIYYTTVKDMQVSVYDGTLGFDVGNADARTQGLEADGRFALTQNLSLRGSLALTDFKFTNYKDAQCYPGQTTNVVNAALQECNDTGKTTQLVSPWQADMAIDYHRPLSNNLEFRSSLDVFGSGRYFASPDLDPDLVQHAYALVNLRLALAQIGGRWELALLAKNLTDEHLLEYGNSTPLAYNIFKIDSHFGYIGEGRTITLQARLKY